MELIEKGLAELNFDPNKDIIFLCRGNIFDIARNELRQRNYVIKDAVIDGELQDRVEQAYLDHLKTLGVDVEREKITIESGKDRYFKLFEWVSRDFYKRRKLVKSGFKKWQTKWSKISERKYHQKYKR